MNKKKTNYLVSIVTIVALVLLAIYLVKAEISEETINPFKKAVLGENNIIYMTQQIIYLIMVSTLAIPIVICGIQNKNYKKLCFWQIVSGIGIIVILALSVFGIVIDEIGVYANYGTILNTVSLYSDDIIRWTYRVVFGIIPMIYAIRNLILIRKKDSNKKRIISYVLAMILAIGCIIGSILRYIWFIVAFIMQIIYIHKQDNIDERKSRKIVNIILYYILFVGIVTIAVVSSIGTFIISKVNNNQYNNQIDKLANEIVLLSEAENDEVYIPVINQNNQYGYINEKGKEAIKCQYNRVSHFNKVYINGKSYYIALVEKNGIFYIISKGNEEILINPDKFIKNTESLLLNSILAGENVANTVFNLNNMLGIYIIEDINKSIRAESADFNEPYKVHKNIEIDKNNIKYYEGYNETITYKNKNYTMQLEHQREHNTKLYKVTITKNNGEKLKSTEYLPDIDIENEKATITTIGENCIRFKSLDGKINGFYDKNGNKVQIASNYTIQDVKNGKILIENQEKEMRYLLNEEGNIIQQGTWITSVECGYIIWDKNTMTLYDNNLNKISNTYNKIIGSYEEDVMSTNATIYKPYTFYKSKLEK